MNYDAERTEQIRELAKGWDRLLHTSEFEINRNRNIVREVLEPTLEVLKETVRESEHDQCVNELVNAIYTFEEENLNFSRFIELFNYLLEQLLEAYWDNNPAGVNVYARDLLNSLDAD